MRLAFTPHPEVGQRRDIRRNALAQPLAAATAMDAGGRVLPGLAQCGYQSRDWWVVSGVWNY